MVHVVAAAAVAFKSGTFFPRVRKPAVTRLHIRHLWWRPHNIRDRSGKIASSVSRVCRIPRSTSLIAVRPSGEAPVDTYFARTRSPPPSRSLLSSQRGRRLGNKRSQRCTDRTRPCSSSPASPPGLGMIRQVSLGARRWRRTCPPSARSTKISCTRRCASVHIQRYNTSGALGPGAAKRNTPSPARSINGMEKSPRLT